MREWRVVHDGRPIAYGVGWELADQQKAARACMAIAREGGLLPEIETRNLGAERWVVLREFDYDSEPQ